VFGHEYRKSDKTSAPLDHNQKLTLAKSSAIRSHDDFYCSHEFAHPTSHSAVPKMFWALIVVMLVGTAGNASFGQIIPASRCINWSRDIVGVPGGIPFRTIIYTNRGHGRL